MSDAESFLSALNTTFKGHQERLRIFRASVTAVASGLVSFQRGDDDEVNDAGAKHLLLRLPKAGDDIALIDVGGAPLVLGAIGAVESLIDLGAPAKGQVYIGRNSNAASEGTGNTTSTTVYSTALTLTWSDLPDGTYGMYVVGSLLAAHSTSAGVNCGVDIAGTVSANAGVSCPTSATPFTRLERNTLIDDVVVAGGITIKTVYKAASAGTASVANPSVLAIAIRKA